MISYKTTTEKASDVERKALLNESDNLWTELRYNHIAKVIEIIKDRMTDIIQNSAVSKTKGQDQTITAMAAAVRELPEYQQTMNKLGQHVAIAQQVRTARHVLCNFFRIFSDFFDIFSCAYYLISLFYFT